MCAQDHIIQNVAPAKGRKMVVEILETTMDFVSMYADFGLTMSGLTNITGQSGAHVWRFVPRRMLSNFTGSGDWAVANTNSAWCHIPEHEDDTVLLLKDAMSSRRLSQPPLLVLPASVCQTIDPAKLTVAPRNALSDREIKDDNVVHM